MLAKKTSQADTKSEGGMVTVRICRPTVWLGLLGWRQVRQVWFQHSGQGTFARKLSMEKNVKKRRLAYRFLKALPHTREPELQGDSRLRKLDQMAETEHNVE